MKRAVGYIRVSTDSQAGPDAYGAASQQADIQAYADKQKLEIVGWYEDLGVSGVDEDRDGLNELLHNHASVTNTDIEYVIVAKSDRLARDIQLYYYYKFVLRRRGVDLISVNDDYSTVGQFGVVMESLTMFIAEQERATIARRTGQGRKQKARRGGYSGGKPAFGYKAVEGRLMVDFEEATVVQNIYRLREEEGKTLNQIANWLNTAGYRTRNGKDFLYGQIYSVLNNRRFYEGDYKYSDGEWVRGMHEPLLARRTIVDDGAGEGRD